MKPAQKLFALLLVLVSFFGAALARADLVLKPTSKSFSANGATGSVSYTITNPSGSPLNSSVVVATEQPWITILSGGGDYTVAPGKKAVGSVKYRVEKNPSVLLREGAISIGGVIFPVTQKGAPCKIAITPAAATVDKDGVKEQPLQIQATLDCGWSATSGSPWIEIDASGTGTGEWQEITYWVGTNDVLKPRAGKVYVQTTVAKPAQKKTHTVKQPAQTMGTLPGTYAGLVNQNTLAQLVVTDKGKVSGSLQNIFGDIWKVAGTLSPLGSLSVTATRTRGTGTYNKTVSLDGTTDSAGDLGLNIHATNEDDGTPRLITATLSKKRPSAVPARYTLTEGLGRNSPAGVIDIAADATVSGLLVNAWSETLSVSGLVLESGKMVAIGTLANKVNAKDPDSSYIFVMEGSYNEGPVFGLSLASEDSDEAFVAYFQKTANRYVGVYGGKFAGTYPGGTFKGSFKIGVNADGSVRGYAISPGDEESTMLTGTANLTTGGFELEIYKYDTQADDYSETPVGQFTGSIAADGAVTGSLSVPSQGAQGTFEGTRLSAVPQLPTYAIGTRYLQYRNFPTAASNFFAGWVGLTKNGEPISGSDATARLLDPDGNEVSPDPAKSGYLAQNYMFYGCAVSPCIAVGPIAENGFYTAYASLGEGTYTYEVTPADGNPKVTAQVAFPGQVTLPFVVGAGMTATWSGGDLTFRWTNPSSDPAWSAVDRIQVTAFDSTNAMLLSIRSPVDATQVTVPDEVISRAKALGNGTLSWWRIETRANDGAGMNFARGYSPSRSIPAAP